ncbi:hypothetical protein [Thermomonospora umbrina]|uniref:DoxX-like protein n=1 Tax=Thermomonospora umbrina TaxID=111806 RepID=A0A3D9SLB2_9ACTN|nr:hypothetical protein [Thermomonospora umbrina]REE95190.1 hypothetical protein DFJ69_0573 [Thermomonospora umbrina]
MSLNKKAGLLLAGTGALHFAAPRLFEPISRVAFPEDTRRWIYTNGATELALGLAVAGARTRRAGLAGVAAYTAWLGARAVRRRGAA